MSNYSQIARKLKPYILAWDELRNVPSITVTGNPGSGGSLVAHALDSAYHTGLLPWVKVDKTGAN